MRWNPDLSCLFGRTLSHDFLPNLFSLRGREIFLVDLRTLSFCSPVEFLHFISLGRDCLFLRHTTRTRHRFSEQKLRLSIFFSVLLTFPRRRRNASDKNILQWSWYYAFFSFLFFFLFSTIIDPTYFYLHEELSRSIKISWTSNLFESVTYCLIRTALRRVEISLWICTLYVKSIRKILWILFFLSLFDR